MNERNQRDTVHKRRAVKDEIHHVPVMDDGTGFRQIDTSVGDKVVYIGNLLVSDRPDVRLTLVDTRPRRAAFVVHNPTDEAITCEVRPGPGFALLADFRKSVTVPAGASLRVKVAAR